MPTRRAVSGAPRVNFYADMQDARRAPPTLRHGSSSDCSLRGSAGSLVAEPASAPEAPAAPSAAEPRAGNTAVPPMFRAAVGLPAEPPPPRKLGLVHRRWRASAANKPQYMWKSGAAKRAARSEPLALPDPGGDGREETCDLGDPAFVCACSLIVMGVVMWCACWIYAMVYFAAWHGGEVFGPANVTAGLRALKAAMLHTDGPNAG